MSAALRLLGTALVCLFLGFGQALALDSQPYDAQHFAQAQAEGKPVALHFHASWCPTCRAQSKVFEGWKADASLPVTLYVVDYDNARELRRQLGVRTQATLIVYKGRNEVSRLAGETDADKLRAALQAAL